MAGKRKKKRASAFARGMVLYVLLFVLVAGLGLNFFYSFLENYEATRPNNVMADTMEKLTDAQIGEMCGDFLASLNEDMTDADAIRAFAVEKVRAADFAKKVAQCTETETVYALKNEDGAFGTVRFTLGDNVFHDLLANWQYAGGSVDFSDQLTQYDITVPSDYTVTVNGYPLDGKYISEERVEYAALKEYASDLELPYMVSYHVDGLMGEPAVTVLDAAGDPVAAERLSEEAYMDNCTPAEKEALNSFVKDYITAYFTYTSNTTGASGINYGRLAAMIVPDSDLINRVALAIGGLGFASYHEDELRGITVHSMMNLGGIYFCDVTYDVATLSSAGITEYPNNTKLLVVENDGRCQALAMVSY